MPTANTIAAWTHETAHMLRSADITSAYLDAEIILAHTLRKNRTWLHAHSDETIPPRILEIANARRDLRLDRVPIAYIIGHKEFYGRLFTVTPSVLIPRPESEAIINILKHLPEIDTKKSLVDIGTGSGCLGITAKLELSHLQVILSDISPHALAVARKNADRLQANVVTLKSSLLDRVPPRQDIILANLPYVDTAWECSPETKHEPNIALFADDGGLKLINQLIQDAKNTLSPKGYLLLEADSRQHARIITLCRENGLSPISQDGFVLAFVRA